MQLIVLPACFVSPASKSNNLPFLSQVVVPIGYLLCFLVAFMIYLEYIYIWTFFGVLLWFTLHLKHTWLLIMIYPSLFMFTIYNFLGGLLWSKCTLPGKYRQLSLAVYKVQHFLFIIWMFKHLEIWKHYHLNISTSWNLDKLQVLFDKLSQTLTLSRWRKRIPSF